MAVTCREGRGTTTVLAVAIMGTLLTQAYREWEYLAGVSARFCANLPCA